MRITTKISCAGANGLSRFPVASATIEECLGENGRLDDAKVIRALANEQIQHSSKDTRAVRAFALEYLTQMRSVVERMAANINAQSGGLAAIVEEPGSKRGGKDKGYRTEAATPGDFRVERNMNRGKYAFSRTDIAANRTGIRAALSFANPREVVGGADLLAHDFSVMCARILNYLKDNITSCAVTLVEGENCAGIFAEARELDRTGDLVKKRQSCPHLVNGAYCSPICPDCPLYDKGKCRQP